MTQWTNKASQGPLFQSFAPDQVFPAQAICLNRKMPCCCLAKDCLFPLPPPPYLVITSLLHTCLYFDYASRLPRSILVPFMPYHFKHPVGRHWRPFLQTIVHTSSQEKKWNTSHMPLDLILSNVNKRSVNCLQYSSVIPPWVTFSIRK